MAAAAAGAFEPTFMLTITEAFTPDITAEIHTWSRAWGDESLASRVRIRYSVRMFRTIGRCAPTRCLVTLAEGVKAMPRATQLEVMCHELAHIAAYEGHGRNIRPHGREWKDLMRRAGYPPRVRFEDEAMIAVLESHARRPRRYLHRCPRCRASRVTSRRMTRWRCGPCYELGFDGRIDIYRLDES